MDKISIGTRKCFIGSAQIPTPVNHGYSPEIFNTLIDQAAFTIKEWTGKDWKDLTTNNLKLLRRHGSY